MKGYHRFQARTPRYDHEGFAFIIALTVMAILAIIVAAFVRLMIGDVVLAGYQRFTTEAIYRAEAGVQEGLFRIKIGRIDPPEGNQVSFRSAADSDVEVTALKRDKDRAVFQITSTGTVRGIRRTVRLIAEFGIIPEIKGIPELQTFWWSVLGPEIEVEGDAEIKSGNLYSQGEIELERGLAPFQIAFAGDEIEARYPGGGEKKEFRTHEEAVAAGVRNLFPGTRVALLRSDWDAIKSDAVPCNTIRPYWDDGLLCKAQDGDPLDDDDVDEIYVVWEQWKSAHPTFFPNTFNDVNSNGLYDFGDPFTDTDGDGKYDAGEPFKDLDRNGVYTPPEEITGIDEEAALRAVIPPLPRLDPLSFWNLADFTMRDGDPDNVVNQPGPHHDVYKPLIVLDSVKPLNTAEGHGVILVNGKLNIQGNVTFYGVIYATDDIDAENDARVYGGLISRDEVEVKGNMTVYARPGPAEYFDLRVEIPPDVWFVKAWNMAWHEMRQAGLFR